MSRTAEEWLALAQEHLRYDAGELYWKKPHPGRRMWQPAGRVRDGYREIFLHGARIGTHRLVWLMHHHWLPDLLDHIDRNPANNRIENLRPCNHSENNANKGTPANNISGHKFIHWEAGRARWVGQIIFKGKLYKKCSKELGVVLAWRDHLLPVLHGEFMPKVMEMRIDKEVPDVH